ncbi:MAG: metallophosphoesterase [Planctomycetes bacterium]|nr:metallophosphoesterase [Planctomycetota bacterium]
MSEDTLVRKFDPEIGADEFRRLMVGLLLALARRHALSFRDPNLYEEQELFVDAVSDNHSFLGTPGPVGFNFGWPRHSWPPRIPRVFHSSGHAMASCPTRVIVAPEEPPPEARDEATLVGEESGVHVELWGATKIRELLRFCPPLLARYFPEDARTVLPNFGGYDFREFAASYRERFAAAHQQLRLLGLPPEVLRERDARKEILLPDIFVPLRLEPEGGGEPKTDLASRFNTGRSAVLLGDPGAGKSSLLAYVALLCAGAAKLPGVSPGDWRVPLLIPLRDFVRLRESRPEMTFVEYLEHRARTGLSLTRAHRAFFESALIMSEGFVLFDGLDEVGGEEARRRVAGMIQEFRREYPGCACWVTSRIYGYTSEIRLSLKDFDHFRLARFELSEVDDFINRWYGQQYPQDARKRNELADSLKKAVRLAGVRRLAGNPLLLTLMAFIHQVLGKLPQDRGELYELCVQMLLKTWQEARTDERSDSRVHPFEKLGLHVQTQKQYLAHLAAYVQERGASAEREDARGLVTRRDALDCLAARHNERCVRERPQLTLAAAREEVVQFLDYISDRTGLLVDRGGELLSFIHLSFQEYLAAWVFTCTGFGAEPEFFLRHLGDPAWEEVLLLRLYIVLCTQGGGGEPAFDRIVRKLLDRLEQGGPPAGWATLGRALRDNLSFRPEDRDRVLAEVLRRWLEKPGPNGEWFAVLEEIALFADPERARQPLRELLGRMVSEGSIGEAAACLYLADRLFGFPSDAPARLAARSDSDFASMVPDLLPLMEREGMPGLLARRTRSVDWLRGFELHDNVPLYMYSLAWATGTRPCPVPSMAPHQAGAMLLWKKIAEDLHSRVKFECSSKQPLEAAWSSMPLRLGAKNSLYEVSVPGAAYRTPLGAVVRALPSIGVPWAGRKARAEESVLVESWAGMWPKPTGSLARALAEWLVGSLAVGSGAPGTSEREPTPTTDPTPWQTGFRKLVHACAASVVQGGYFGQVFRRGPPPDPGVNLVAGEANRLWQALPESLAATYLDEFVVPFFGNSIPAFSQVLAAELEPHARRPYAHGLFVGRLGVDLAKDDWEVRLAHALRQPPVLKIGLSVFLQAQRNCCHRWVQLDSPGDPMAPRVVLREPIALLPWLCVFEETLASAHAMVATRALHAEFAPGKAPGEALPAWLRRNPSQVWAAALAWEELAITARQVRGRLSGPEGVLLLAHAAYAALITGLPCDGPEWKKLLDSRDSADPVIRFGYALHEICHFRDEEKNAAEVRAFLANPPAELRPALAAAGWLTPEAGDPSTGAGAPVRRHDAVLPVAPGARAIPTKPEPEILFSWIHLSDIHVEPPDPHHAQDQKLVLDALRRDVEGRQAEHLPAPDALLVTGDIAYRGVAGQYAKAKTWLLDLAQLVNLEPAQVYAVPGNHDVDRDVDKNDGNARRLVHCLRKGTDDLDSALDQAPDRELLARRLGNYLAFASELAPACLGARTDPATRLWWHHRVEGRGGLRLRLIGLNTALLSADELDSGRLRLGTRCIAEVLTDPPVEEPEVLIVLTHHPLRGAWLADETEADRWVQARAQIHLSGHVHSTDLELSRSGAGSELIRVVAGAVHAEVPQPGVAPDHGYNFAALVRDVDGTLKLRVWPRRWSDKNKDFRSDGDNLPRGAAYSEHAVQKIKLPARE